MKRCLLISLVMLWAGLVHGLAIQSYQANLYNRFYVGPDCQVLISV